MNQPLKYLRTIATTLSLVLSLSGCEKITADEHLQNAKQYLEENDDAAAEIELKNAIQQDETAVEPRMLLGSIYLENGEFLRAIHQFEQAQANGVKAIEVEPLLARALLATEDTVNTIELVDNSDITLASVKSELIAMKSLALTLIDEYEQAQQALDQSKNLSKSGYYQSLATAKLLSYQGELSQSIEVAKSATDSNPDNSDGWLMLGHTYTADRNFKDAAEAYQKAIDLNPVAIHYKLHQARALVLDSQFERARENLDELVAYAPENRMLNELNAITLYAEQNLIDAGIAAGIALQKGSRNLRLRLIAAVGDMEEKNYRSALEEFAYVIPYLNSDHYANRLYAVALAETGEIDKAEAFLTQLAGESEEHNDFIIDMSREFQKMGRQDVTEALIASEATEELTQRGRTQLALMKITQQDESGIEELQTLIAEEPKLTDSYQAIVYYYLAANDFDNAVASADKWVKEAPESEKALVARALVAQKQGNNDEALQYIANAEAINNSTVSAPLLKADILRQQDKLEQSYTLLLDLAKENPNHPLVAKSLFVSANELNKTEEVLALYQSFNTEGENPLMLARAFVAAGNTPKAIELLEAIPANQANTTTLSLLSRLHVSLGNYTQAEVSAKKWLEIAPNNRDALDQLIGLYEYNSKNQLALEVLEQAEKRYPANAGYTTAKARLLARQGKFTVALDAINSRENWEGAELSKEWSLAQIHTERRMFEKALPHFEKVYKELPNTRSTLALARTYQSLERYDDAEQLLTKMIDQKINGYQSLELMLAQVQLLQDPNSALNQYQSILERDPNNLVALNNLAWVYLDTEQFELACDYAQQAYSLAGRLPQIQDTYGYCLLKQGDIEKGAQLIESAYQQLPNEDEVVLHYAESLMLEKRFTESKALLRKVNTTDKRLTDLKLRIESNLQ